MKNLIGACLVAIWFISSIARAEGEYIFPTPFSEARCRWENKAGKTLHVYEGARSPGFNTQNERECGLAIQALALSVQGLWMTFDSFDGEIEFRPQHGETIRCQTKTVDFVEILPDEFIQNYRSAARAQRASIQLLESMATSMDRYIKVVCHSELAF